MSRVVYKARDSLGRVAEGAKYSVKQVERVLNDLFPGANLTFKDIPRKIEQLKKEGGKENQNVVVFLKELLAGRTGSATPVAA